MQHRGTAASTSLDSEDGDQQNIPPSRGRPTSKLRVLGRSHAMREEASPPRESTQVQGNPQLYSPCIKLIPSPEPSIIQDKPVVVLSLSPDRTEDPDNPLQASLRVECVSPAATLVPSPNSRSTNVNNVNNNHSNVNNNVISSPNTLYVSKGGASARGRLRQQSSSQGSFGSFESSSMSPCLSRDNSSEQYTDFGGVDLEQFIPETLNRNAKDRALMLRIEQELVSLAKDRVKTHYKFPPMSSYQRMLVHRCAAYFGMDHNIEPSGKSVVVNKTKNTRIPEVEFREHIKEDIVFTEEPRRSILKRDSNSIEDYYKSPERGYDNRRSKSFEEREEEYEKVRRRIFSREMHEGTSEDSGWSEIPWSSTESEYISKYRLQPPELQARHLRRLFKVHSEDAAEAMRPCVAKSFSFGGYGGGNVSLLTRGDSVMSTHSAGPRLLTKQDSGASSCVSWRLSPSSSGYKSQSQMSESVTPSPTNTPHPGGEEGGEGQHHRNKPDSHLVWAVTDIHSVPKGSVIINPETGKPLKNDDGTIYHYDPNRPPPGFFSQPTPPPLKVDAASSPQRSPQREVAAPRSPQRENTTTQVQKPSTTKHSPIKKQSSFTNSATSPSLPFSPPLSTCSSAVHSSKSCPYLQAAPSCENVTNLPQQPHHYPNYSTPAESNVPTVYPQPYIVYTAPYGVPVQPQFDGRLDPPSITSDLATTYYVAEGAPQTPSQTYQTHQAPQAPPFWNQPAFYPGGAPPPQQANVSAQQRYSVAISPQGQTIYMPSGYPTSVNYLSQPAAPPPPPQCAQSTEMVPVYPGQPVQMVYSQQPSTPTPVIYTQNPMVYSTAGYPPQGMQSYPQSIPTPNGCNPSVSAHQFLTASASSQPTDLSSVQPPNYVQLSQSMHQMALGLPPQPAAPRGFMAVNLKYTPPFDQRPFAGSKSGTPKYQNQPRGSFTTCSGQNSGGTSSPAGTVITTSYCPQGAGAPGIPPPYRTPSSTPPTPQFLSFQPGFNCAPPRLFRQMSGGRETTPGTARSSRSPTPAGDIAHFDRQRMSLPPNLYQGMPYILQPDPRFFGRGQPNVYRQTPPTLSRQSSLNQDYNRSQNNSRQGRKPRGNNKQGGLPPNGQN